MDYHKKDIVLYHGELYAVFSTPSKLNNFFIENVEQSDTHSIYGYYKKSKPHISKKVNRNEVELYKSQQDNLQEVMNYIDTLTVDCDIRYYIEGLNHNFIEYHTGTIKKINKKTITLKNDTVVKKINVLIN